MGNVKGLRYFMKSADPSRKITVGQAKGLIRQSYKNGFSAGRRKKNKGAS